MTSLSAQTYLELSEGGELVHPRVAATPHVQVELLRCRSAATVQWQTTGGRATLMCVRDRGGHARITLAGGRSERVTRGHTNFWFFPEGIVARGEVTGEGAYDCAGVFVDPGFLLPRVREVLTEPMTGFCCNALERAFDSLVAELAEPADEVQPLFTDGWAMQSFAYLTRAASRVTPRPPAARTGLAPWQLRRAQELLRADLSANTPLLSIAAACKLSVSHFARAFKISTGLTPHQWLIGERIGAARSLLADSAMPLVEVANNCGFGDQSHFTRVFARTMGASPGAWRHYNRREPIMPTHASYAR